VDVDELRAEARSWLARHRAEAPADYGPILPPHFYERGRTWQRLLFAEGWAGIHWPVEYGGRGLTPEHNAAWMEECALAGVAPFINMVGVVLAGGALMRFGTPAQQHRHLRSTLTADEVWCQLFSEPGAGSDLAGLTTSAVRDGEQYVVNGQKVWCSGGRYSDWGILLARTDPTAPRHKGISFVLLDMHAPGVDVRALRQMTGEAEFDEVFLTDVVVPADCLLGPENDGWAVAMAVLTNERGHIGASVIGLERRLESLATIGAGDRLDPLSRDRLASLLGRGHAMKSLGQRQAAEISGSLMKLGISELLFDAAMLRGAIAGADAVLEGPDARGMLAAPGGRIAGGTSQIQRTIIGERLLGLPREPKGER
jgi:alkylation response protein AidB-like acyl-CoA dehydrogenase